MPTVKGTRGVVGGFSPDDDEDGAETSTTLHCVRIRTPRKPKCIRSIVVGHALSLFARSDRCSPPRKTAPLGWER